MRAIHGLQLVLSELRHGKKRQIPFGPESQKLLANLWPIHGDPFFPSAVLINKPYTTTVLRQAIGHAAMRAGAGRWSPYQLRHDHLTKVAVDRGLETAARDAGHSETSTTLIYTHQPYADQIQRALIQPQWTSGIMMQTRLDGIGA